MLAKHKGWTFTNVHMKEGINRMIEKLDRNTILIYGGGLSESQIMTFSKSCHEIKDVKNRAIRPESRIMNTIFANCSTKMQALRQMTNQRLVFKCDLKNGILVEFRVREKEEVLVSQEIKHDKLLS